MGTVRRPWTADDDQVLRDMHATGQSLGAIAKHLGRGKSTIHNQAARLGLSWDRTQTASAANAKMHDARARRAAALEAELELLELAQAHARKGLTGGGWRTVMRGAMGAETTQTLEFVPPRDLRDSTSARASMAVVIDKLTDTDASAAHARSMLDALADSLGVTGSAT